MPRADPLLLLTVAGLAGSGLLASLYPETDFEPADAGAQGGRRVRVLLLVVEASAGDGWWRGEALPLVSTRDGTARYEGAAAFPWLWFRPPDEGVAAGDELRGRALVQRDSGGVTLVLDGPAAASLTKGDRPVAVRWQDVLNAPERLEGRVVLLLARATEDRLLSPDGEHACLLATDAILDGAEPDALRTWVVRLERTEVSPGWLCRPEALAP